MSDISFSVKNRIKKISNISKLIKNANNNNTLTNNNTQSTLTNNTLSNNKFIKKGINIDFVELFINRNEIFSILQPDILVLCSALSTHSNNNTTRTNNNTLNTHSNTNLGINLVLEYVISNNNISNNLNSLDISLFCPYTEMSDKFRNYNNNLNNNTFILGIVVSVNIFFEQVIVSLDNNRLQPVSNNIPLNILTNNNTTNISFNLLPELDIYTCIYNNTNDIVNDYTLKKSKSMIPLIHDLPLFKNPQGTFILRSAYNINNPFNSLISTVNKENCLNSSNILEYGVQFAKQQKYDLAILCYNLLIANTSSIDGYNARGCAKVMKKEYNSAISDFKVVLSVDPNNECAINYMKYAQSKLSED